MNRRRRVVSSRTQRRRAAGLALVLLLAAVPSGLAASKAIFARDSLYHRIFVHQDGSVRSLRFGASRYALNQSKIDTRQLGRHLLEYSRLAFAGLLFTEAPKRVLVIGLGGGVIPRQMRRHYPDAQIDVVEIDPQVAHVAKTYFFFRTDKRMRVHVADGRVFVRRQKARKPRPAYDIIILDAFNSEYIPFHMTTREFLQEVAAVLHPKGVVVANVFQGNRLFDAQLQTFRAVYGRSYVFVAWRTSNAILVAPGPKAAPLTFLQVASRAEQLQKQRRFTFSLPAVARQLRPGFQGRSDAPVLTDDKAPANVLRHRKR